MRQVSIFDLSVLLVLAAAPSLAAKGGLCEPRYKEYSAVGESYCIETEFLDSGTRPSRELILQKLRMFVRLTLGKKQLGVMTIVVDDRGYLSIVSMSSPTPPYKLTPEMRLQQYLKTDRRIVAGQVIVWHELATAWVKFGSKVEEIQLAGSRSARHLFLPPGCSLASARVFKHNPALEQGQWIKLCVVCETAPNVQWSMATFGKILKELGIEKGLLHLKENWLLAEFGGPLFDLFHTGPATSDLRLAAPGVQCSANAVSRGKPQIECELNAPDR